jgi:transposase
VSCIARWQKIADREDGLVGRPAGGDADAEMRELPKRNKQLEHENEILRRATGYFARDTLPKRCSRWSVSWPPTVFPSR